MTTILILNENDNDNDNSYDNKGCNTYSDSTTGSFHPWDGNCIRDKYSEALRQGMTALATAAVCLVRPV